MARKPFDELGPEWDEDDDLPLAFITDDEDDADDQDPDWADEDDEDDDDWPDDDLDDDEVDDPYDD